METSLIRDEDLRSKIEFVCRCLANKAPIRFLMACLLGKLDDPKVDIRKPYTEIGGKGSFSGRAYDEKFIEPFVINHKLPTNWTTAFLTPAFRNIDRKLTTDLVLVGRPRQVYSNAIALLDSVQRGKIKPADALKEIIRFLLIIKNENEVRMQQLHRSLKHSEDTLPLSSEQIITLLQQHLSSKNSSRLPVLMIAAAYLAVKDRVGEAALPLHSHNAADRQTGSIGDVEVTLVNDDQLITCYEMKDKRVTIIDLENAMQKLSRLEPRIDNYIFITTEVIDDEINQYAKNIYDTTGIEIVVLDCIGFVRHFLHFFHRHRASFLNNYQNLVLAEPDSSVSQPLKEAFLILRKAAESDR
ncbi:MAG: restriction endonuclease, SacI family [candidate division KSB1 bacterium]